MATLGADVAALERLGAAMARSSQLVGRVGTELDRHVRSLRWSGADAQRFRRWWEDLPRTELLRGSQLLDGLSRQLDRQAAEQRRASAFGVSSRPGHAPARVGATTPLIMTLPRSEVTFLGGLEVDLGPIAVALSGELTIQRLGEGRSRVVFTEVATGGPGGGIGVAGEVAAGGSGSDAPGVQAHAQARLGPLERRSWDVGDHEVDALVARLALERSSLLHTGVRDPLRSAGSALDSLSRALTGVDPGLDDLLGGRVAAPEPARVERLAELGFTVGATASLLGPLGGGRGQASGTLRVGVAESPGAQSSRSIVVEAHHDLAGALTSQLAGRLGVTLPAGAAAASTFRLEVPTGEPTGRPVTLLATSGQGATRTELRVAASGPPRALGHLERAAAALAVGDTASAAAQLALLAPGELRVESATSAASVHERAVGAKGSVGLGPRVGLGAHGQVRELRR